MDEEIVCNLVPEAEANKFHLLNDLDPFYRDTLANTLNEESALQMKVKFAELHHGRMMSEEGKWWGATLLLLDFVFISRKHGRRYKSAQVTLEFSDKNHNPQRSPRIVAIAPHGAHWLEKTANDKKLTYGASVGAQAGVTGLATGDASAHWEVQQTKSERSHIKLMGVTSHTAENHNWETRVAWSMDENEHHREGIPTFLQAAVLLRHNTPWMARIHTQSKVDHRSQLSRLIKVTGDQDPIIQDVSFPQGVDQHRVRRVTTISHADLQQMHLLNIKEYFKVNKSEQDSLIPVQTPMEGTKGGTGTAKESEEGEDEKQEARETKKVQLKGVIAAAEPVTVHEKQTAAASHESRGAEEALQCAAAAAFQAAKAAAAAATAAADASAAAVAAAEAAFRVMKLS